MPNRFNSHEPEPDGTSMFVGIIVSLALLAIGYLVFTANGGAF